MSNVNPRRDILQARRLAKSLRGEKRSGSVYVRLDNKSAAYKRRMAIITTGKSDYYSPMEALRRAIVASVVDEEKVAECRSVDPRSVNATAPSDIAPDGEKKSGRAFFKALLKRVPYGFIRVWRASGHGWYAGHFFLYSDKVLHVRRHDCRWIHTNVPPEGIEVRK